MKKYILTENQIKKVIESVISEQGAKSGTTSTKAWEGLKNRLKTAYYYDEQDPNTLVYSFDKLGQAVVTYKPNGPVGTLGMGIKFNDPKIVAKNGATISKIQSLLGTKFQNNELRADRPDGYLTQNINSVCNMLFNVLLFNGKTWANTPMDDVTLDKGEIDANDFSNN